MSFNQLDPAVLLLALDAVDDRLRRIVVKQYCYYDDRNDIRDAADRLAGDDRRILYAVFESLQLYSAAPDDARYYLPGLAVSRIALAIITRCPFSVGDLVRHKDNPAPYVIHQLGISAVNGQTVLYITEANVPRPDSPFGVGANDCRPWADDSGPPAHVWCKTTQ